MATAPNFIIIGEQKSGTGWLRDRLLEHDDAYICPKEIHYFDRMDNFDKGKDWYFSNFNSGAGKVAVGEKTPGYFWLNRGKDGYIQDIHSRIHNAIDDVQLVLSLRNPIDRAVSAFLHHLRHRGRRINPHNLNRYSAIDLMSGEVDRRFGIIQRGFYSARLKAYLDRFGDRLLTLIFEDDIVAQPELGMRAVCEHLHINYQNAQFKLRENKKQVKPSLSAIQAGYWVPLLRPVFRRFDFGTPYRLILTSDERSQLAQMYQDDVAQTRELLGKNVWQQDWN